MGKKKIAWSKLVLLFLFLTCTFLILFTCFVVLKEFTLAQMIMIAPDLSPLNTLIGIVIAETLGLTAYLIKSTFENRKGGITYDAAAAHNFQEQGKG